MYKQAMDRWFCANPKSEREYQQLVLRENNGGKLARATDYFIIDMEYADTDLDARFDMVALKWPSTGAARKDTARPSLALIEMKYGDNSLSGDSGLQKHLSDFDKFLGDAQKVEAVRADMEKVFQQKCELGLVSGLQKHQYSISLSADAPEVIFLLADHDPDSDRLRQALAPLRAEDYSFPIRFATASLMGYGLFESRMMSLERFKESLAK
jgi:hypothetical protein